MTKRTLTAVSAAAALAAALLPMTSEAVPAFARQTGKTCLTCHFQNFPILNAYGQEFKAGGFVDIGKQGQIKGPDLSIPETLNMAMVGKWRAVSTNDSAKTTEYGIPDEFGFLIGGRAAANVGYLVEASTVGSPALAGFKMPITVAKTEGGTRFTVVPFATGGIGAGYGMELLNTGAVANVRPFEHGFATSAMQYVNGEYSAWGLTGVASSQDFFVNVSRWTPQWNPAGVKGSPDANYIRAAWLGNVMGFESGAGVQIFSGTVTAVDALASTSANTGGAAGSTFDVKSTAVDFQAQGSVAAMPLGIWASYANAPKSTGTAVNFFNNSTVSDKSAIAIGAQLGAFHHAAVKLGFRKATDGQGMIDNAVTVGANYHLAQNLGLLIEHTIFSQGNNIQSLQGVDANGNPTGGNARTTVMLETAF
ncbi:hypothetical protein [Leptothrix ochracea]|uniref:hypothetical protein n=1 Tax=Leptothrix ochracea TaxID=735331 RepID=UPI0034E22EE0